MIHLRKKQIIITISIVLLFIGFCFLGYFIWNDSNNDEILFRTTGFDNEGDTVIIDDITYVPYDGPWEWSPKDMQYIGQARFYNQWIPGNYDIFVSPSVDEPILLYTENAESPYLIAFDTRLPSIFDANITFAEVNYDDQVDGEYYLRKVPISLDGRLSDVVYIDTERTTRNDTEFYLDARLVLCCESEYKLYINCVLLSDDMGRIIVQISPNQKHDKWLYYYLKDEYMEIIVSALNR